MQWLWKQTDAEDRQHFIIGSDRWMASHKGAENSDRRNVSASEVSAVSMQSTDQQQPNVNSQDPSVSLYSPETGLRSNSPNTDVYLRKLSSLKLPSDAKLYPDVYQGSAEFEDSSMNRRSGSLYPDLFRDQTAGDGSSSIGKEKDIYPSIRVATDAAVEATAGDRGSIYPEIYSDSVAAENSNIHGEMSSDHSRGISAVSVGDASDGGSEKQSLAEQSEEVESAEEVLVKIPDVMVHLIDEQGSALLASGDFSLLRLVQNGNALAIFARVGDDFQWPIAKDEATAKLDPAHYFFTIRAADEDEEEASSVEFESSTSPSKSEKVAPGHTPAENLNYGVTFSVQGNEQALKELDQLLKQYSLFSAPTIVQGDPKNVEAALTCGTKAGADQIDNEIGKVVPPADAAKIPRKVVPKAVLGGKQGKKPSDESSTAFWTTLAPNVEDYHSSLARAIAAGTGQIIRSIFWCSETTMANIQKGGTFVKGYLKPGTAQAPGHPRVLKNIRRARKISKMSQKTADAILSGVVKTVGFFSSSVVNSRGGKKLFRLLPGEVALASLDAFGKIFDAVEVAGKNVLSATSVETSGVISHRYGVEAGELTHESLKTVGYAIGTIWTVSKIRKVLNPKSAAKPSTVMKTATKAVYAEMKK